MSRSDKELYAFPFAVSDYLLIRLSKRSDYIPVAFNNTGTEGNCFNSLIKILSFANQAVAACAVCCLKRLQAPILGMMLLEQLCTKEIREVVFAPARGLAL